MAEAGGERLAVHLLLDGHVQGVGFRWHTRLEARSLGLVGWVRNLDDGRVEAHAEGPEAAVAQFVAWLHQGPSGARVDKVDMAEAAVLGARSFEIL